MEGYVTKDYSPNVEEEIIIDIDTPDENGDLKEAIHEKAKDIFKAQLNRVYGIYGLIWSHDIFDRKKKALAKLEKELGLHFNYYRRRVLTNNRLKRMHKPMTRRGEK